RDADVKALLWEIKRLRDVMGTAESMTRQLHSDQPVHRDYFLGRLEELFARERYWFGAKALESSSLQGRKPERQAVTGYAQRRIEQVGEAAEATEREAKKEARARRG